LRLSEACYRSVKKRNWVVTEMCGYGCGGGMIQTRISSGTGPPFPPF
jgi:hypothetical protein